MRRWRISWVIGAAVAAVIVLAGVDALRSSESKTALPTATASTTPDEEPRRSPEQAIEVTGNTWARLFGAGRTCNRFMHQPACEWVVCRSVGVLGPIRNCTPVSSKVQRSFAGAVVQDIAIRGQQAAALFSNGETVRFQAIGTSGDWWIDRVGAGRKFFELSDSGA